MTSHFIGDCRVTGIGSLPHTDPAQACDFMLNACSELPYWPQLPQRDEREGMIDQFARGLPGIDSGSHSANVASPAFQGQLEAFYEKILTAELSEFALADFESSALVELEERALKGALPERAEFKGQITGPVTMGLQLLDAEKRFLIYSDTFRQAIVQQLIKKGRWLEDKLSRLSSEGRSVIFLDEPLLYTYGSGHYNFPREHVISMLQDVLGGMAGVTGIHACSNCDWSLMFEAKPDIFSFDAYSYPDTFFLFKDQAVDFIRSGGVVAWGIVPNTDGLYDTETGETLLARMDAIIEKLVAEGLNKPQILRQSLITPGCGVGSLTIESATRVFTLANEVARGLKGSL